MSAQIMVIVADYLFIYACGTAAAAATGPGTDLSQRLSPDYVLIYKSQVHIEINAGFRVCH